MHPTGPMMATSIGASFPAGVVGPPQLKQPPPQSVIANVPPPQPVYEG